MMRAVECHLSRPPPKGGSAVGVGYRSTDHGQSRAVGSPATRSANRTDKTGIHRHTTARRPPGTPTELARTDFVGLATATRHYGSSPDPRFRHRREDLSPQVRPPRFERARKCPDDHYLPSAHLHQHLTANRAESPAHQIPADRVADRLRDDETNTTWFP